MTLAAKIEALMFTSSHPIGLAKLAQLTGADVEDVKVAADELAGTLDGGERGIRLIRHAQSVQLATAPDAAKLISAFQKDEQRAELTKPALETLTIITYRGPISKAELDTIRGVNCSLILRNLLIKGLIETAEGSTSTGQRYQVTFDFIRYLGVERVEDLPEYEKLHSDEHIDKLLHPVIPTESKAEADPDQVEVEPVTQDA